MSQHHIADEYYEDQTYQDKPIPKGLYENCEFKNCTFANSDLSDVIFSHCTFDTCDMTMVNLKGTGLQHIEFINCKILGLHFEDCNQLMMTMRFKDYIIEFCTFIAMSISKTKWKDCTLLECDFSNTNISHSIFSKTDLNRTKFIKCDLQEADLSTAYNFIINPTQNNMKGCLVSRDGAQGLLDDFGIELC